MSDAARLYASTDDHEGFRPRQYLDSRNLWTIGTGRCLETNPLTAEELKTLFDRGWLTMTIAKQGSDWLRERGLAEVERDLAVRFSEIWPFLDDARQNALIEMGFQLGVTNLVGFAQMWKAIRAADWEGAKREALDSLWAKQTPARAEELAEQLRTGAFA